MNGKISLITICLLLIYLITKGQSFEQSQSCHKNVNDPSLLNFGRGGVISASFKYNDRGGECSGTLVNRNTSDEDVGFYFLTARHCIKDTDFGLLHFLYFNYQSSNADNAGTARTNEGHDFNAQSGIYLTPYFNCGSVLDCRDGYEYLHITRLRLVADFIWGDFALIEILTPLPPHFNVTYSGWNPSRFYNGVGIGTNNPALPAEFVGVHHPRGDIKKINVRLTFYG